MENKKKHNVVIILSILVILIVGFAFFGVFESEETDRSLSNESTVVARNNNQDDEVPQSGGKSEVEKMKKFVEEKGGDPEAAGKMLDFVMSQIRPIRLYGKIVDQTGLPLANADILYTHTVAPGFSPPRRKTIQSDIQGRFRVENITGQVLTILSITKDGYECSTFYGGRNYFRESSSDTRFGWSAYSERKPFVYDCWKFGAKVDSYSNKGTIDVEADRRIYSITFENTKLLVKEGVDINAHMQIRLRATRGKSIGDWEVQMSPISGGIIKPKNRYLYLAPQHGYSNSWEKSYKISEKGYKSMILDEKFYLYAMNKNVYIKLNIGISPFRSRGSRFYIEYTVNTEGSRSFQ